MLSPAFVEKISGIVGRENVLTDRESLISYASDATRYVSLPDAVIKPGNTEEVSRSVALAFDQSVPIIPRGGGTGLSGGSVPARGGVVLSTERMVSPASIHKEDLYATVEPGVTTESFQRQVESHGLFYPIDPVSKAACTIGGNVAECAAGLRSLKYGTTRNYVLGLEIVTPEGKVVRSGARTVKSVAGYDVTRLMAGSQGSLGVITSVNLRLLPQPESRRHLWCWFESVAAASEAVADLIGAGLIPSVLELMDEKTVKGVEAHLGETLGTGALLLCELDGSSSVSDEDASKLVGILKGKYGREVGAGQGTDETEKLWRARASALPALTRLASTLVIEDLTVPRSELPDMVERVERVGARYGVRVALYGHAGDGNMHACFLTDKTDAEEMKRVSVAISEMMRACIDLGGAISGEYGIGTGKKPVAALVIGEAGGGILKRIKRAIDPKGIMNPGKMFDEA